MSFFKEFKKAGFSLVELSLVLGLVGVVGLGGAYVFSNMGKSKNNLERQTEFIGLEKQLRLALMSTYGCQALMNKQVGDSIVVVDQNGKDLLAPYQAANKVSVESLTFARFTASGDVEESGLGTFVLEMKSLTSKTTVKKDITLSLKMNSGRVVGCDTNKNQLRDFIKSKLCSGIFGEKTKNLDCEAAMELITKDIKQSICEDITGISGVSSDPFCELQNSHAGVSCPPDKYLNGFNTDGSIICGIAAPPVAAKPCNAWSSWQPLASNVCSTATIYQVKNCLDGGTPSVQSQTVLGSKTTDECNVVKACLAYSPTWSPAADLICSGVSINQEKSCLDGGVPEKIYNSTTGTKTTGECAPSGGGGGGGGGGSCFVAGTLVTLSNGLTKKIEDLKVGELVQTFDEKAGRILLRPIKEVFHHQEKLSAMFHFELSNGYAIKSNDVHLYFIPEVNKYLSAVELYQHFIVGSPLSLIGPDGTLVEIKNIIVSTEKIKLFNIHVVGAYDEGARESSYNHNYFANGVLVHNLKQIDDLEMNQAY